MSDRRARAVGGAAAVWGCLFAGVCAPAPALGNWLPPPPATDEDVAYTSHPTECRAVQVVDGRGRPLEGADVTLWSGDPFKVRGVSGQIWQTDRRGMVCEADLFEGGTISVQAPARLGGWCTGDRKLRLNARQPVVGRRSVTRVVLTPRSIPRSNWRGRVVSPESNPITPIAGATVRIGTVAIGECTENIDDVVTTASDGTFVLPMIPHGDYAFEVQHKHYAERTFPVKVPGPAQDLVLDRGATWTGRVLDPDGALIKSPQMYLRKPGDELLGKVEISATGFKLSVLPPGDFTLSIIIAGHPTLGDRQLKVKITVQPNEARQQDILWPKGATISGTVVAAADGRPVAGARVRALPPGAWEPPNQHAPDEVNVRTDPDGRFVLRHLTPGDWVVRVRGQRAGTTVATGTTAVRLTQ